MARTKRSSVSWELTKTSAGEKSLRNNCARHKKWMRSGQLLPESRTILITCYRHFEGNLSANCCGLVLNLRKTTGSVYLRLTRPLPRPSIAPASLTRQLLMFGRRQVMRPKPLDLNKVVENTTTKCRNGSSVSISRVEERFQCVLAVHLVLADANMMEQVLINLAVNSQAMPCLKAENWPSKSPSGHRG